MGRGATFLLLLSLLLSLALAEPFESIRRKNAAKGPPHGFPDEAMARERDAAKEWVRSQQREEEYARAMLGLAESTHSARARTARLEEQLQAALAVFGLGSTGRPPMYAEGATYVSADGTACALPCDAPLADGARLLAGRRPLVIGTSSFSMAILFCPPAPPGSASHSPPPPPDPSTCSTAAAVSFAQVAGGSVVASAGLYDRERR